MDKPLLLESNNKLFIALWWLLLVICLAYAGFAFEMLRVEFNVFIGSPFPVEGKIRQVPVAFMLHALLGGIGLVAGILQFNSRIRRSNIRIHRAIGCTYLVAIWGASLSGVLNAVYFDVPDTAKAIFVVVGVWWFISTTLGYWHIRQRVVSLHRHWMIRSYAISLFFITFPIWVPTLQMISPDEVAWPIGLLLAAALNVLAAELWIRKR